MDITGFNLKSRLILITGAARRVGRILALSAARAGADVILHHSHSGEAAMATQAEIAAMGRKAWIISGDLSSPDEAGQLFFKASQYGRIDGLVNNAAIFEPMNIYTTTPLDWQRHMDINLTAPFLLSQALARQTPAGQCARIVNILDWRALRPGKDHFPYTITKAALAAMTKALALALAPNIIVNGLALGAILPPVDGTNQPDLLQNVPQKRWAQEQELGEAFLFALAGPDYITGEIIHLDGGRHLV